MSVYGQTIELDDGPSSFACAICGGGTTRWLRADAHRLSRCTECGHGFFAPMPSSDDIAGFYSVAYYGQGGKKQQALVEALLRASGARSASAIGASLSPGATVVDLGCGRGVLASALARRGFNVIGIERSRDATHGIDSRVDLRIASTVDEAQLKPGSVDAAVVWHVLEHLPQPIEALTSLARALRPGGRLFCAVPNLDSWQARAFGRHWLHLDLPRHLHHFTPESLRRALSVSGFALDGLHTRDPVQNLAGLTQSALNWVGLPHNRLFESVQAVTERRVPPLLDLASAGLAAPTLVAALAIEALADRGGTLVSRAVLERAS